MNPYSEWLRAAISKIAEDPASFYERFYEGRIDRAGQSDRVNPCPFCQGEDCFTVTEGFPGAHCFRASCGVHGTHIDLLLKYRHGGSQSQVFQEVADYLQLPLPQDMEAGLRDQAIKREFAELCHEKLLVNEHALRHETETRKHSVESLKTFKVGLTPNFNEAREHLIAKGYTREEINQALPFVPEGLIIYPYREITTGEITRFNTKNPFNRTDSDGNVIAGWSYGEKQWLCTPTVDFKQVILVEGENDEVSLYEAGATSAMATGGSLSQEQIDYLEKFENIYCMFDNDSSGDSYLVRVAESMPHKMVFKVTYDEAYNDPDLYFKEAEAPVPLEELIQQAQLVPVTGHKISHNGHLWQIMTRSKRLEFEVTSRTKNGEILGTIRYFENSQEPDWEQGKSLSKYKNKRAKNFTYALYVAIIGFYDGTMHSKTLDELIDAYQFSHRRESIIKSMATVLHRANMDEALISKITDRLGNDAADSVLREINQISNGVITDVYAIKRVKASQFFDRVANRSFMYYTKVNVEGDQVRKIPHLISNDKRDIRLDLLKRKDPLSLLLIDGKYELPFEVPTALFELEEASLTQEWVEKWVNDEVPADQLEPRLLLRQIEGLLRMFFYTQDELVYKALALYVYGSYYYELVGVYPYLFLNGEKGSGKSSLANVLSYLCFNARFCVDISPSSLFRLVSVAGGTLIIDEAERLSKGEALDETMSSILKGGYSAQGKVFRTNIEKGIVEAFNVFCPKIICNIEGIDRVLLDRCLVINTYECPPERRSQIAKPKVLEERLQETRQLTSKCALSVLNNFNQVYEIYCNKTVETSSARLSQIMAPLFSLADFVGGEYPDLLKQYFDTMVVEIKAEINLHSPDWMLKSIMRDIVMEYIGLQVAELTVVDDSSRIRGGLERQNNSFKISDLKIKLLLEVAMPGEKLSLDTVNKLMKQVYPDIYREKARTSTIISNEMLMREFNNNSKLNINIYPFNFSRIVPNFERLRAQVEPEVVNQPQPNNPESNSPLENQLPNREVATKQHTGRYDRF